MEGEVPVLKITDARILSALTLPTRVALKRELQRLCRTHSATAAFLWTASGSGGKACGVETVGDLNVLPRLNHLGGPVWVDREQREVVLLYSRVCTDARVLILGLVDTRAPFTDVLTDDMEEAVERIESLSSTCWTRCPCFCGRSQVASRARSRAGLDDSRIARRPPAVAREHGDAPAHRRSGRHPTELRRDPAPIDIACRRW